MKNRLWLVPFAFLIGTYFLTSGGQLYKLINVVDTYIYFIYAQIVFNAVLIALVFFVFAKISALTALPGFITESFVASFAADALKEKGAEVFDKMDKIQMLKEKFETFSMPSLFLRLGVSLSSLVAAYALVAENGAEVAFDVKIGALLAVNLFFISHFFYAQLGSKPSRSAAVLG